MAASLGYRPSQIARGLVTRQSTTFGLVMPDVANPFFAQIARGAEDVAYSHGYSLFLINTGEDPDREKSAMNSLLEKEIDGAVLCGSRLSQDEMIKYLEVLPAAVLVNRELDLPDVHAASLNVDDSSGAQIAVDYLVNQGRNKVAFITGPENSVSGRRGLKGYQAGLNAHGIALQRERLEFCSPTTDGGESAAMQLLQRCPEVNAVLAFNDLVTVGVIRACQHTGRSVPADVSVIGADDIPLAALTNPSLTTLHVDLNALGSQVMMALLNLIDSPLGVAEKILIQPELRIRQSA